MRYTSACAAGRWHSGSESGAIIAALLKRALVGACVLAALLALAPAALAAIITVNTTADNAAAGTYCAGASGDCSLRQAVAKAQPGDTVALPAGTYKLDSANGPIAIAQNLTIAGTGLPTVDGQGQIQVFSVTGAPTLTISGIEITGGNNANGSAIGTDGGTLTLSGDTFTGNLSGGGATPGNGSVYINASASSSLTITDSTFTNEHVGVGSGGGEGVVNDSSTAAETINITGSSFNGNFVGGSGGGFGTLWISPGNSSTSSVTIDSSSFNDNVLGPGGGFGGGISMESGISHGTMTITDSQFEGNQLGSSTSSGFGGGLEMEGPWDVTVSGSTFSGNVLGGPDGSGSSNAPGSAFGGGIYQTDGNLTVIDSAFADNTLGGQGGSLRNSSDGFGGGIAFNGNNLTISGSTFNGNNVGGDGGAGGGSGSGTGGAVSDETGSNTTLTITNSTMTDNRAGGAAGTAPNSGDGVGGAIDGEFGTNSTITLINDTIDGNAAGAGGLGGGIYPAAKTFDVSNTIITGNTLGGAPNDCDTPATVSDHNLEHGSSSCGFSQPGDLSADPLLRPLADNGGPTKTQLLADTPSLSPAIDAGDPGACPTTDQRGDTRPDGAGTACDIGAVETPDVSTDPLSVQESASPGQTSAAQTVTVIDSSPAGVTFGPSALSLAGADAADFHISSDTCSGQTLSSSHSCTFKVSFSAPSNSGDYTAAVQIADNAGDSPQSLPLQGTSGAPDITIQPPSVSFGASSDRLPVGTGPHHQAILVTNTSNSSVTLGTLDISGPDASQFSLASDTCSGQTIATGKTCSATVMFAPSGAGTFSATLNVPDSSGNPHDVPLSGAAGISQASVTPASLSFNAVGQQQVTVTNSSAKTELVTNGVTVTGAGASQFSTTSNCGTVTPKGHCHVTVKFDPADIGTFHAQLSVSDSAPDSPQMVTLTGKQDFSLAGHVYNASHSTHTPLVGARVFACPQGQIFSQSCQTATTSDTGLYGLLLGDGTWVVQVDPPAGSTLAGTTAQDVVSKSSVTTQDFDLTEPQGLSDGFSFDGQTSGVPLFNYRDPFSLGIPLPIPTTGPPNSLQLFTGFAGIDAGPQSSDPSQELVQAAVILVTAHYGADGNVTAVSTPAIGPVNCASSSEASACASIAGMMGTQSAAAVGRSRFARTDQCYVEPSSPPGPASTVTDVTVQPNDAGGINIVVTTADGGSTTIFIPQMQLPDLSGDHPWLNAGVHLLNAGINAIPGPLGWYNAVVSALNSAANASQNGHLLQNLSSAAWQIITQGLSSKFHGGFQLLWDLATSDVNSGFISPTQPTSTTVSSCSSHHADAYADPSGVIRTPAGVPIKGATVTLKSNIGHQGRLTEVPNGSIIMSPANRHNPSLTNAFGVYGWDVLPGKYQIVATHPGCTGTVVGTKEAKSKVLPVPPAQTGVNLVLKCPSLRRHRAEVKLTVSKASNKYSASVLVATVSGAGAGAPQGTVVFMEGRHNLGSGRVLPGTGAARLWIPGTTKLTGTVRATYLGDADYAPASRTVSVP